MTKNKKQLTIIVLILVFSCVKYFYNQSQPETQGSKQIEEAFTSKRSDVQVTSDGKVVKILPDDVIGSKHQRFIVSVSPKLTVLIAHNIDLAPKVPLKKGSQIRFSGEYEWNQKGGVVHWTHHDPQGRHKGGWIEFNGKRYQ